MKITVLDLFSGIGGFHLGLTRAGFEVESYFSEIDKYAIDVYSNNFKNATYVGSVVDIRGTELPRIDAITFGSPCQDFSLAGKRKGLEGDRSSLIGEAIRLISECRPRFFIWENVKGTFSSNNGADFWAIMQAFANIGGYRLEWQLLNTKWFLPQNRERIYLVGYLANGSGGQVFPIGEVSESNTSPKEQGDACACITATYYKGVAGGRQHIEVNSATTKGYEEATEGDAINLSVPTSKTRRGRVGKGVAQTLDTHCNQAVIGDFRNDTGYRERKDGDSPTLNARAREDIFGQPIVKYKGSPVQLGQSEQTFAHKSGTLIGKENQDAFTIRSANPNGVKLENKIRRLTPVECERLQGFPDNWTKYGTKGEISDSQRYKMCGNAVTVDVVKAVAERVKLVI